MPQAEQRGAGRSLRAPNSFDAQLLSELVKASFSTKATASFFSTIVSTFSGYGHLPEPKDATMSILASARRRTRPCDQGINTFDLHGYLMPRVLFQIFRASNDLQLFQIH